MTTTLQTLQYYSGLLINQYASKPKAVATIQAAVSGMIMAQVSVQVISFSAAPTSGTFMLSYNSINSSTMNWNDSAATIQSNLQGITGLGSISVTGSIASQTLTVTFTGVIPPALSLVEVVSSLMSSSILVTLAINEIDLTLPLAVQAAYNVFGPNTAQGVQLDIIGKYAGVTRNGYGFQGQPITLDDADFMSLIQMAILTNSAGSSLYDIQNILQIFFAGEVYVFDYTDMRLTYLIAAGVGSSNLIQLFVTEGLLPAPMAVQVSVIYAPIINAFFGFVTYDNPVQPTLTRPFNTYDNYHTDWPFLIYDDSVSA